MTTRVAILVIASTNQDLYRHYIATHWTEFIRRVEPERPHLHAYFLVDHDDDPAPFAHVADHVLTDPVADFDHLLAPRFQSKGTPSILTKTVHALDALAGEYDLFFRTNLSSIVMPAAFDRLVQSRHDLGYSGPFVWTDALRADLLAHDRVGPDRFVTSMSDLDGYPGNTFVSGSGFFVNAREAAHLVAERDCLPYGVPDDVAVGLMFERHEQLPGFGERILPEVPIVEMLDRIERSDAGYVRLEHFPIERARALWRYLRHSDAWLGEC